MGAPPAVPVSSVRPDLLASRGLPGTRRLQRNPDLAEYDIVDRIRYTAFAGARIARESADAWSTPDRPRWVIGTVGPGTRLPTLDHAPYALLRNAYHEQCEAMIEGGIDAVLVETSQDLLQTKAAVVGAQRAMTAVAERLIDTLVGEWGMRESDIRVDTLTFTLGTGQEESRKDGAATVEALRALSEGRPEVGTTLGLSNISFGLKPAIRVVLNSVFLHECRQACGGPRRRRSTARGPASTPPTGARRSAPTAEPQNGGAGTLLSVALGAATGPPTTSSWSRRADPGCASPEAKYFAAR